MGTTFRLEGKKIVFKSPATNGKWIVLFEKGGACWACGGKGGVLTENLDGFFVVTCMKCANTIRLRNHPGKLEVEE